MAKDMHEQVPTVLQGVDGPIRLEGMQLVESLACSRCRYDLRGAAANGTCAECGFPIPYSIGQMIDPVAHRNLALANPSAVGRGLVVVVTSLLVMHLVGMLGRLLVIFSVATTGNAAPKEIFILGIYGWVVLFTGVLGIASSWWIRPASKKARPEAWRGVWRMAIGSNMLVFLGAWMLWAMWAILLLDSLTSVLEVVGIQSRFVGVGIHLAPLLSVVAGGIVLWGLCGVLLQVGLQSRAFRVGGAGRQRIPSLLIALAIMLLSWVVYLWFPVHMLMSAESRGALDGMELIPLVLAAITDLFVAVGLFYLMTNMFWVRHALIKPPPRLSTLLKPAA